MGRKVTTTKEDLMTVVNLLEDSGIKYWIDGGWALIYWQENRQEFTEILI